MFKTILLMSRWLLNSKVEKRRRYVDLLKTTPHIAIQEFWKEMGMQDLFGTDYEMQMALKHLHGNNAGPFFQIATESFSRNRLWNEKQSLSGIDFADISCIDILLADDSFVTMPNRINTNVVDHSYSISNAASKVDELMRGEIVKSHAPPELAMAMQLLASQMKREA
jgi:hypothetical protein